MAFTTGGTDFLGLRGCLGGGGGAGIFFTNGGFTCGGMGFWAGGFGAVTGISAFLTLGGGGGGGRDGFSCAWLNKPTASKHRVSRVNRSFMAFVFNEMQYPPAFHKPINKYLESVKRF